jgi:hypothetical protein
VFKAYKFSAKIRRKLYLIGFGGSIPLDFLKQ